MLARWAVKLAAYDYEIVHQAGMKIPQADYLSRFAAQQEAPLVTDTYFLTPLPVDRNKLIEDTKLYYSVILTSIKRGWSSTAKRKYRELYKRKDVMTVSPDGLIFVNEKPLIPPSDRKDFLDYIHSSHLGIKKTKSLTRSTCFWPEMEKDIIYYITNCKKCLSKPTTVLNCHSWPGTYQPMQRIHCDYCGPFLSKYYALVIIDSYSKWPEVYLTLNTTSTFTKTALRKFFSREGIAQCIVTDNGRHFSAIDLQNWIKSINQSITSSSKQRPCIKFC